MLGWRLKYRFYKIMRYLNVKFLKEVKEVFSSAISSSFLVCKLKKQFLTAFTTN